MRRVCARAAAGGVSRSARRCPTATWPASAAGSSTSSPAELADDVLYQLGRARRHRARGGRPGAPTSSRTARSTTPPSRTRSRPRAVVDAVVAYDRGAAGARPARLGAAAGGRGGRAAHGRRGLRRPRLHGRGHARAPRASRAPWCTTRPRWPSGRCAWRPRARSSAVDGTRGAGRRRVGLRARRHPGRRGAGPGGAGGARGRGARRGAFAALAAQPAAPREVPAARSRPASRSAATSSTAPPGRRRARASGSRARVRQLQVDAHRAHRLPDRGPPPGRRAVHPLRPLGRRPSTRRRRR